MTTGPVQLVIMSDTHLPRAKRLPDELWRAVDAADVVVHAGDWCDLATLEALEARAARLIGVWGNNDGADLRERHPEVARETVAGRGARPAVRRPIPTSTCWSSGTATSRGTPSPAPGCAC